jgi:hypothetical protein
MYISLRIKYPLLLSKLMKFSLQVVETYSNVNFVKIFPVGSRVVPRGQTEGDMTEIIDVLQKFCEST